MLRVEPFAVGPLGTTCVLVWDTSRSTGVVVDPGADPELIRRRVEIFGIQVEALLHTHAHFDHVGATAALQAAWACPAYLHPADGYLIGSLDMQTSLFGMPRVSPPRMEPFPEALPLGLGLLHTPGHSRGSCTFVGEGESGPFALVGDTLFQGGVGRTDVLGGDTDSLMASIRDVLYGLDDATAVIPGHGPATTIGREARSNPFVRR